MRLFLLFLLSFSFVAASDASDAAVYEKALIVFCIVPILGCLYAIIVSFKTLRQLENIKTLCNDLAENTESMARAAAMASLGPSAKKALLEYAKEKPELAKLFKTQ